MEMSDEQFKRLLETIALRDMIIRIDENTKNSHDNFQKHEADDAAFQLLVTKTVDKVHTRLDTAKIEIDNYYRVQNRLMGGIAALVFIVPIAVAYFNH